MKSHLLLAITLSGVNPAGDQNSEDASTAKLQADLESGEKMLTDIDQEIRTIYQKELQFISQTRFAENKSIDLKLRFPHILVNPDFKVEQFINALQDERSYLIERQIPILRKLSQIYSDKACSSYQKSLDLRNSIINDPAFKALPLSDRLQLRQEIYDADPTLDDIDICEENQARRIEEYAAINTIVDAADSTLDSK